MSIICIGGACIDRKYTALAAFAPGTSNPVRARRHFGGVARNVAENLARLGVRTGLMSAVGNDENGIALLEHAQRAGLDTSLTLRDGANVTAEYAALVAPDGELSIGVADMSAIDGITVDHLEAAWPRLAAAEWLFADCNVPAASLAWLIGKARSRGPRLAIDAVSEPKVGKLPEDLTGVSLLVLNEREAAAYLHEPYETFAARAPEERAGVLHARGVAHVVLTLGERGVLASGPHGMDHLAAAARHRIDATGAGDALCAGVLFALQSGRTLLEGARIGTLAAALTVESPWSVRPDLSPSLLEVRARRLDDACTLS